jgi:phosphatidylinositol-3-phosphatase
MANDRGAHPTRYRRWVPVVAIVALTAVVAGTSGSAASGSAAFAADTQCGSKYGQTPTSWDHVTVIVFENKTLSQIIGSADAPYLTSLATTCSYATNMNHMTPTSLTNYIAMTSGYTGHTNDKEVLITGTKAPRIWPQDSVSIFEAMGSGAREWAESMPSPCAMKNVGDFNVGHTPYQYYTRTATTLCPQYAVSLGSSTAMSARYNLLIPNEAHDMHGTSTLTTSTARIRAGDAWTSTFVPTMLASPEYKAGKSVIIITWDEANAKTTKMPYIVISPYTKAGGTTDVRYDHYSTLKGVQQMLGVSPLLGHAADATVSSIAGDPVFNL